MTPLPDPSRKIDAQVHRRFRGRVLDLQSGPIADAGLPVPAYTTSIDAVVGLVKDVMPGWIWRLCECHVSDDAWLMPDENHPQHGEEIKGLWPDMRDPLEDGPGLDTSFAPAGRPALAMLAVLIEVIDALEAERSADATCPAYHAFVDTLEEPPTLFDREELYERIRSSLRDPQPQQEPA